MDTYNPEKIGSRTEPSKKTLELFSRKKAQGHSMRKYNENNRSSLREGFHLFKGFTRKGCIQKTKRRKGQIVMEGFKSHVWMPSIRKNGEWIFKPTIVLRGKRLCLVMFMILSRNVPN